MELQKELKKWAEETAEFYDKKATSGDENYDLAFYTQSDLTKIKQSPDLLILAINPGSEGSYSEQKNSELWKNWGINGYMNGKTLLKGNPTWEKRNEEWKKPNFWQRLNIIFNDGNIKEILQDESRFVLSNLTLFATKKEKELPGLLDECTKKTIQLINVLQPKHILCLGGKNCIDPLKNIGKFDVKELLPFGNLSYGKFNKIPVYAIKHTTSPYTREEMDLVRNTLNYLMDNPNKEFSAEEIQEKFADDIKAVESRKADKKKAMAPLVESLSGKSGLKGEIVGDGLKFSYNNVYIVLAEVDGKIYSSIKTEEAFKGKATFQGKADIFTHDTHQKHNPYGLSIFDNWQHWSKNIDVLKEEKGLEKFLLEEIEKIKNWIDNNLR